MSAVGRFAPTPSGRMHLGNLFSALLSWLSVRSQGGEWILRMEDLDTQRCRQDYAHRLRQDLIRLGLTWNREAPPQSMRTEAYQEAFQQLRERDLLYPCYCTRGRLHSVNAPHRADGVYVYDGRCRNLSPTERAAFHRPPAWRLRVPDRTLSVWDGVQGAYTENLAGDCGDFIVRRADSVFVYQLAVVVDDAAAGVTEVVRGRDLLSSTPRQLYLQELLGYPHPRYYHVPMLLAPDGRRLSKRDRDLDLEVLSRQMRPEALTGLLACWAGLLPQPEPIRPDDLIPLFHWSKIPRRDIPVFFSTS